MHCHVQDSKTHIPCAAETALEPCRTGTHKYACDTPSSGTENEIFPVSGDSDKKPKDVDFVSMIQIVDNKNTAESSTHPLDADDEENEATAKLGFEPRFKVARAPPELSCMAKQVTNKPCHFYL